MSRTSGLSSPAFVLPAVVFGLLIWPIFDAVVGAIESASSVMLSWHFFRRFFFQMAQNFFQCEPTLVLDRVSKLPTVGFRKELEHAIGFFADAVTGELSLPVQRLVPTINCAPKRATPTSDLRTSMRCAIGTSR